MLRRYYTSYDVRLVLHFVQLLVLAQRFNGKGETDNKATQSHTQVTRRQTVGQAIHRGHSATKDRAAKSIITYRK